jgi:hypothetical protein
MRRAVIFTAKHSETEAVKEQLLGPVDNPRTVFPCVYNIYHLRSAVYNDEPVNNLDVYEPHR